MYDRPIQESVGADDGVLLAAASLAPFPTLAGNMSLTIDGVGASIEVLAFNFGAKNPVVLSGGGSGTGKATLSEFAFTATESAASATLFNYVTTGKHSPSARLAVLDPDTGSLRSEWVLTDVLVTAFGVQNGELSTKAKQPNTFSIPVNAYGLAFQKACYRIFAVDGSVAKETCWNLATNSSS